MMMDLHSNGKAIEDIVQVLKRIPIHPRIIPAIKAANALGYLYTPFIFVFVLLGSLCKNYYSIKKKC